jgi:hypothetical protein
VMIEFSRMDVLLFMVVFVVKRPAGVRVLG